MWREGGGGGVRGCANQVEVREEQGPGGREGGMSQGNSGAGMFELAGQHPSVQLVELHQVDQVGELGGAVVEAEEHLTVLLQLHGDNREKKKR